MSQKRIGYMCKVDFDHELGEAPGGIKVYSSIGECLRERKCADHCGIVEVSVSLKQVVKESAWFAECRQ